MLVSSEEELERQALYLLDEYHQTIVCETYIPGKEYNVALLYDGENTSVIGTVEVVRKDGTEIGIFDAQDSEMKMRSCIVVLIGSQTASRRWVQYEIEQACKLGKGIMGIYIHNLSNSAGDHSSKGHNPFEDFCVDKTFNYIVHNSTPADSNEIRLSSICKAYDPTWYTSNYVYDDIKSNIEWLIEEAITTRNRYPK
ncbi:MAG: TIR domain-containing protein [Firmicutes bacterium]|nr:TIR domain-containing protein [Bacillota bacterium]